MYEYIIIEYTSTLHEYTTRAHKCASAQEHDYAYKRVVHESTDIWVQEYKTSTRYSAEAHKYTSTRVRGQHEYTSTRVHKYTSARARQHTQRHDYIQALERVHGHCTPVHEYTSTGSSGVDVAMSRNQLFL